MNLPAIPVTIEFKSLRAWLPEHVCSTLQSELENWKRKSPERLKDEASMRYIFMSVLDLYGLKCPHPYRLPIAGYAKSFECRMCRSYVFYKGEYEPPT